MVRRPGVVGANHVAAKAGIDDDLTRAEAYVRAIGEAHSELLDETALKRWLTVRLYNNGHRVQQRICTQPRAHPRLPRRRRTRRA